MEGALTPITPADTGRGIQHVPGIGSQGSLNAAVAHRAGHAGSPAIGRDTQSDRRTASDVLARVAAGAKATGALVTTTSAPVLDGRSERAVIRTVPRIHTPRAATVLSGSTADALPHRHGVGPSEAAPSSGRTSANGRAARPEWFPTFNRCSSSPGVSCEDGIDLVPGGRCVDAGRSGVTAAYRRRQSLRSTNRFAHWRACSPGRPRARCSSASRAGTPTI